MPWLSWCGLFLFLSFVGPAAAQEPVEHQPTTPSATPTQAFDAEPLLDVNTSEWMVAGGPAFGIVVFHSASGHRYMLQTLSWGRVLTDPHLQGPLRGRFEWAFEAAPIFGQYAPISTYGFGFMPLVWRWNFEPRGSFAPFAELAGGALWTNDPVPAGTTTANFSAHAAYGVRYFVRPQQAVVVSYRFHHISNGNRVDRNPGVNAHVLMFGFSLLRPRK